MTGKTAEEMIEEYGFNDEQAEQLRELLSAEYAEFFALLIGGSITLSVAEIAEIMASLPDDLSEERLEVVLMAYFASRKGQLLLGRQVSCYRLGQPLGNADEGHSRRQLYYQNGSSVRNGL